VAGRKRSRRHAMQTLVTGITGRIGANLGAALRREGHAVRGLVWERDQRVQKLEGLGVELCEGDLAKSEDVRRVVEGCEMVYHLGSAFQGGGPFTEEEYFEINVRGTFNVLEAARHTAALEGVVFASTDALYDKYVPGGLDSPIREDEMPRRPSGWYALSKSVGEELCSGYCRTYKLPVVILRFPAVVGAGEILDFRQFYLSKMRSQPDLASLWTGEERLVVLADADGRPYKKHIGDVRDVVHGCVCALGCRDAIGQTIQLGGPAPFTWDEAVPYLSDRIGIPWVRAACGGVPTYYEYDLTRAREVLGFNPEFDIFRMIDDAVAYRNGEHTGILPTD